MAILANIYRDRTPNNSKENTSMKAFITVLGKDKVGIIATVSNILADYKINIEDISQTVLQGMFTMIMAVDLTNSALPIDELSKSLKASGELVGMEINIRSEEIFNAMHRI